MVIRSISEVFDTFQKYGFERVLLQRKVNSKGKVSYCLRVSLEPGFPVELEPRVAEEFMKCLERQDAYLKGFHLEKTLSGDPERTFFKMVRSEFGHEEAHHALTGE